MDVDSLVALEAHQGNVGRGGQRLSELRLPHAGLALDQERPADPKRQVDDRRQPFIDQVALCGERLAQLVDRLRRAHATSTGSASQSRTTSSTLAAAMATAFQPRARARAPTRRPPPAGSRRSAPARVARPSPSPWSAPARDWRGGHRQRARLREPPARSGRGFPAARPDRQRRSAPGRRSRRAAPATGRSRRCRSRRPPHPRAGRSDRRDRWAEPVVTPEDVPDASDDHPWAHATFTAT